MAHGQQSEESKSWRWASKKSVDKLARQVADLRRQLELIERVSSQKTVVAALGRIEKAIRESREVITPQQEAKILETSAKLDANDTRVEEALKKDQPE